jgi:hypothetical protein
VSIHDGEVVPIERTGPRVTLYENPRLLREFIPVLEETPADDVAVIENQAITEYTMRMVNEQYIRPHVVFLANVRQDHNDTLGTDRQTIARSFARSIPEGTHVVDGEQHPVIHDYLREEIEARGATISKVPVPERHREMIGAETVHGVNEILRVLDEPPISDEEIDRRLRGIQPEWTVLPGGRLFNAAEVNEIESTELFRRALVPDGEPILPFVFLRGDRRGRTASFTDYVDVLGERDCIDEVHIGGDYRSVFARAVDVPAVKHDTDRRSADDVLDDLMATGPPVVFMANTVHPFMREMEAVVESRAVDADSPEREVERSA